MGQYDASQNMIAEVILKNRKVTITKLRENELQAKVEANKEKDTAGDNVNTTEEKESEAAAPKEMLRIEKENEETQSLFLDQSAKVVDDKGQEISKLPLWDYADQVKREFYRNLLQQKYNDIENLIVLSGAGTSVGIGKGKKGLTMSGLWDALTKSDKKDCLKVLIKKAGDYKGKDLEELLSLATMFHSVNKDSDLLDAIDTVKDFIVQECTLLLESEAPHRAFLTKIGLRPQKFPRVKLFTLNYDTLFEQAAVAERFTVIDGFTFSNPRVFNGKYFDYDIIETRHNRQDKKDSTIAKLFYLFKMHGSLNWRKNTNEIEQTEEPIKTNERVMIFPQSNKYEHSYEQPYFEMMARFQQALRAENTLLITIGFSFYDKHISSVVLESLKQNPSLNLICITFSEVVGKSADHQVELHRICDFQSRVTLVAESFADFTEQFPENLAHRRLDVLDSLNEYLTKKTPSE